MISPDSLIKISIVTPTLRVGGAEKVAVNLANTYASQGYEVDLVVLRMEGLYFEALSDDVNLINLNAKRARYALFKLRQYLIKQAPSITISVIKETNIILSLASWGLKGPMLAYREADTLNSLTGPMNIKGLLYRILMRLSYKRTHIIIANSFGTRESLLKYKIIGDSKIKVIPNPVLPSNYAELMEQSVEHQWLDNPDTRVILSVGRLCEQKNFTFLIRCFRELVKIKKEARLLIVGTGPKKDALLALINHLQLREKVKLLEFQNNIFPYYAKADVFALASKWEGFGNVLVEALAAGSPIVSTDCPGGPRMILNHGQYGYLVPLGDQQKYVAALSDALEVGVTRKQHLIDRAEEFTVDQIAERYLEAIKEASSQEM